MALLELIKGGSAVSFSLSYGETLIGRHSECRIQLAYQTVSGVHAKVITRAGHFYLEDLGSSNGTYVNDQPISEPVRLKHNDCLRLGKIVMRFKHNLPLHVELTNDEIDMTLITSSVQGKPRFEAHETQPEAKLKAVIDYLLLNEVAIAGA